MEGYEKLVKKMLAEHGWMFLRSAKGSHEYWGKENFKPVTVPHGCKSRHTANGIMREAKFNYKF